MKSNRVPQEKLEEILKGYHIPILHKDGCIYADNTPKGDDGAKLLIDVTEATWADLFIWLYDHKP